MCGLSESKELRDFIQQAEVAKREGAPLVTLKHARRMFSSWDGKNRAMPLVRGAVRKAGKKIENNGHCTASDLDFAISVLGPHWPLAERQNGEDRQKGTDEVAETSNDPSDEGDLHGGDGNSGEVDFVSLTESSEVRHIRELKKLLDVTVAYEVKKASESDESGRGNAITCDIATARKNYASWASPNGVEDVHRAIKKFFEKTEEGNGKRTESLRVDPRRLVREVVQQSYRISQIRRAEMENEVGIKLFLVDVSGSCPSCPEVMVAALDLVDNDPDESTILIVHSNGVPTEIYGKKAEILPDPREVRGSFLSDESAWDWWLQVFEIWPKWSGCIAWGDMDADRAFYEIAQRCPFVLLDAYAACSGIKPRAKKFFGMKWYTVGPINTWPKKPVAVWQGVNNFPTTASALRVIAKRL